MAVPQLQLANLGEIFAQNQARQAEMDTMQLQQAEALAARDARIEKENREKLLREKLATGEVNLQSPEGFSQLLNMGVITPEQYLSANETLAAIDKNKAQGEAATLKAQTAQQKLELDRQNIQSQIQNRNAQLRISAAQLGISQQNANATYMRARAAYDKDRAELLGQSAYNLKQLPPEQQGPAYQIWRQQHLANGTFEESDLPPEYDDKVVTAFALGFANKNAGPLSKIGQIEEDFRRGRISQQQRDAAIAKETSTNSTRITTSPTGGVVIEEGGMPVGGAQTSPVGVTSQQSFVSRNLGRLEDIATGKEGEAKRFFATGVPAATGALGAWTPAGVTRTLIDNVKGNMTIDKLVADRQASPTGASPFGNLTEKEMKIVRDSISTLENSQTEQEFLRNLRDTTDLYNDLTRGNPNEIVNFFLSGKVNPFDAADAIKRKNPQNYKLSVPSLAVIQNLPPALQSAMSGMQVRDQQTGQTITINAPTPTGGGQGGGWSIKLKQ